MERCDGGSIWLSPRTRQKGLAREWQGGKAEYCFIWLSLLGVSVVNGGSTGRSGPALLKQHKKPLGICVFFEIRISGCGIQRQGL